MRTASTRLVLALLVSMAPTGAALACSIIEFTPSDGPVRGASCSYTYYVNTARAVGLSEASDLGGGYVIQHATDGNACYREWNVVLHDCTTRNVLVIGSARADYPWDPEPPMYDLFDQVETAAAAGRPLTLDALAGLAAAAGYGNALRVPVGTRLSINGYRVPSDCACDTFYPRASGG